MSTRDVNNKLKKAFPADQVLFKGVEAYKERNNSYLSQLESDITPRVIFLPKSAKEVSEFLKIIKPCVGDGARFAIRGAGQQPLPGCANIQDEITLDLALLSGIQVSKGGVSIAAGGRWGAVYNELSKDGLGVTGARSGNNGIGGLALSGGLSFFGSREGFVCDNVVNYEVVLASGDIVNANAEENPDLFKALKGGGNNFGVVTRFDMRTFTQGPFWGGAVFYFADQFPTQVEALVNEMTRPNASEETHIMISLFFAEELAKGMGLNQALGLNQAYYTQEVEKPPVLEPFVAMQPQIEQLNSMRMTSLKDAAEEQAAMARTGVRCAYMNTTVKPDVATLKAASELFSAALEKVKDLEGIVYSLTMQPYPASLLKKTDELGGNVLGLESANGSLISFLFLMYWKNRSDDQVILKTSQELLDQVDTDAAARGTAVPYKYLNYAFTGQDPIGSYGAGNKEFLQRVSEKYDPEGLFQKVVPGGFKLFT
ncbi:hypothetical protein DL767_010580 [Monosporascus sp. MG133]|nr:hypothetical protein DL767_010580 [Monosporascus sp. MG133]